MSNLHYPGNKRGNIPVSNDKLNEGLIADKVGHPLIINGQAYDGNSSVTVDTSVPTDFLEAVEFVKNYVAATQEPTGFINGEFIKVMYSSEFRTITLMEPFTVYWKGTVVQELLPGWESPQHGTENGTYYLYYDGTSIQFSTEPWEFKVVMIAFINYTGYPHGLREVHGTMPHTDHAVLHKAIGTIRYSGGDISNIIKNSTTAVNRRPYISATRLLDEDLPTNLVMLNTNQYTQRYFTGLQDLEYTFDSTDIIKLVGNVPQYNLNTAGTWTDSPFPNGHYGAVFVLAVPVTDDDGSQKYRYQFVQPQQTSNTQSIIAALGSGNLNLGMIASLLTEYVFIAKITIRYIGGNWSITEVDTLSGSRVNQIATPSGNFLTGVTTDETLDGNGTPSDPLRVAKPTEIRTLPTRYDLPNVGDPLILYSIMEEGALYMWDITVMHYVCIGRDYENIDIIDGGSALNG